MSSHDNCSVGKKKKEKAGQEEKRVTGNFTFRWVVREGVLVFQSYCNKILQTGWLKQQFFSSEDWTSKTEVPAALVSLEVSLIGL